MMTLIIMIMITLTIMIIVTFLMLQIMIPGTGDWLALVLRDGHLEFTFDLGSGPTTVRLVILTSLGNYAFSHFYKFPLFQEHFQGCPGLLAQCHRHQVPSNLHSRKMKPFFLFFLFSHDFSSHSIFFLIIFWPLSSLPMTK